MTCHKPNGEESFARHGEQEELARRVDADGKLINRALDYFSKEAFHSDRNRYLESERERDRAWSSESESDRSLDSSILVRNHKIVLNLSFQFILARLP